MTHIFLQDKSRLLLVSIPPIYKTEKTHSLPGRLLRAIYYDKASVTVHMKSPGPSVSGAWLRRPVIPGAIEYHPGNGATGCALTLRKSSSASPIQPGRSTPSTRPDTAALTLSEHTFFWGRARGGGGATPPLLMQQKAATVT